MNDFMPEAVLNYLPYGIGLTVALVGLFILRLIFRSIINRRVRAIKDDPAMSMMDIDRMRKRGLVDETEYRAIRRALAESEIDKERRRQQAERDKLILAQVEHDPEAAKLLLSPEYQSPPAAPPPHPVAAPAVKGLAPRPALAATGAPRSPRSAPQPVSAVPAPQAQPSAAPPRRLSDLDVLLEKGAITLEEYDRLRAFMD